MLQQILQSLVAGALQGLTEFLPISSSGHLLILHELLNFNFVDDLAFDVVLHLGTLLALALFFWRDVATYAAALLQPPSHQDENQRLAWYLVLATLPAVAVGYFFESIIETALRSTTIVALMLIVGGMGGVNNWIIAPTRGLMLGLRESAAPAIFSACNRRGAPHSLLIIQAVIVSIVTLIFLLLPTINASYWLLTALASQLYMLMYIMMFVSALRLRYKNTLRENGFMIPGGKLGMWIVALAGLLGSCVTLVIGFIPPENINIGAVWHYEGLLILCLVSMTALPLLIFLRKPSLASVAMARVVEEA